MNNTSDALSKFDRANRRTENWDAVSHLGYIASQLQVQHATQTHTTDLQLWKQALLIV